MMRDTVSMPVPRPSAPETAAEPWHCQRPCWAAQRRLLVRLPLDGGPAHPHCCSSHLPRRLLYPLKHLHPCHHHLPGCGATQHVVAKAKEGVGATTGHGAECSPSTNASQNFQNFMLMQQAHMTHLVKCLLLIEAEKAQGGPPLL